MAGLFVAPATETVQSEFKQDAVCVQAGALGSGSRFDMKTLISLATAVGVAVSTFPALAMPVTNVVPSLDSSASDIISVATNGWAKRVNRHGHVYRHRHYAREGRIYSQRGEFYPQDNGGYRVNRYGFGNYVGGPSGGFAGYPAGSGGAYVYRQQQEWKCEAVPETC
jgi:hypothetical protein